MQGIPQWMVLAADIGQSAVIVFSLAAYLPQWIKIWRTRTSGAMSVPAWITWTFSSILALFYAVVQLLVTGRGWALVAASAFSLAFVVTTLVLVVRFRPEAARNQ